MGFGLGSDFLVCFFGGVSNLIFICLGFFLWCQICSLRRILPRHAPHHSGRRLLPVQQPPATAVSVLHARRMAYTRQGSLSLVWHVWVMACLPRRGWRFFCRSEVFWWISDVEEVSGGVACTAGDGATRRRSRFVFFVLGCFISFFSVLFTICLCDA
jgi:hypothetical protein